MLVQPLSGYSNVGKVIAAEVVARQYEKFPGLNEKYGKEGYHKCFQDACFHVAYLMEAVAQERADVFVAYTGWVKTVLKGHGVDGAELNHHLHLLLDVAGDVLKGEERDTALNILSQALESFPGISTSPESFISVGKPLGDVAEQYLGLLLNNDKQAAYSLIHEMIEEHGISVQEIYLDIFQPVQREIGRLWQNRDITVAQEHYCSAVTQFVMSQLYPYIFNDQRLGKTFVGACVGEELHEIGIRMVADFVEMEGWDTAYLGANVPVADIIKYVRAHDTDVLGLSASMPFHVSRVRQIIEEIRAENDLAQLPIMVGGYAFVGGGADWRTTGANFYGADAQQAILQLREIA